MTTGPLLPEITGAGSGRIPLETIVVAKTGNADGNIVDSNGLLHRHYDARPGTYYLIRPDQHVAARWREFSREKVLRALERATGH